MENYFNYFTEIEEHFQQRRGTLTLLSPLDWALMEIWKDAGIPLEAVLRGMDEAFDKWERRPKRSQKVNGLAYCAQAVLAAAEEMTEAMVGKAATTKNQAGPDLESVREYLMANADQVECAAVPETLRGMSLEMAASLRSMAEGLDSANAGSLENAERRLTVMEEKLLAALLASMPESVLLQVRTEADHDLAPYRGRMTGVQIEQLHRQYVHKRLLEQYRIPRLSLFYMQ